MNETSTQRITSARNYLQAFGRRYDYDISYLEDLMAASPGAFLAFEAVLPMGRYQQAAPQELLTLVKIAAMRVEDCGPCAELGVKLGREAGVPENVIRGAWHGGEGLSPEHLDIYQYARGVAANEELDAELLPRLKARWGSEVLAELAIAIVASRLYPTLKRALGHAQSCSLMPDLKA